MRPFFYRLPPCSCTGDAPQSLARSLRQEFTPAIAHHPDVKWCANVVPDDARRLSPPCAGLSAVRPCNGYVPARLAGLREEWARSHQVLELRTAMQDVHAFVYGIWAEVSLTLHLTLVLYLAPDPKPNPDVSPDPIRTATLNLSLHLHTSTSIASQAVSKLVYVAKRLHAS